MKTTENHHENRMHVIHFDSKGQLHHLLALFSRSRTRPHFEDAYESIWHFIEMVYSKKRLHLALDYRSPDQFELEVL